uniref:Uncharacterized protein n=1 Tax=Labrus bergylta TaxID=56723 RepID=A0A3Q3FT28_9LABR
MSSFLDFGWVAMTSEECPAPLGSISSTGPGQSEEYSSTHADDIIEEVGPGDDVSIGSDISALVLPFPELAPVVFFCLKQTTCPRNWCIRMVSSPYPFHTLLGAALEITFLALNLHRPLTSHYSPVVISSLCAALKMTPTSVHTHAHFSCFLHSFLLLV